MKPTTITVTVDHYESGKGFVTYNETAVLTNIEGHDVYVLESATNGSKRKCTGDVDYTSALFRWDGERIMCAWTFGRTGKSLRWSCVIVNVKTKQILRTTTGMNGATNHGRGASLRFVDWDGSKYAAALAESQRTGKKILRAF